MPPFYSAQRKKGIQTAQEREGRIASQIEVNRILCARISQGRRRKNTGQMAGFRKSGIKAMDPTHPWRNKMSTFTIIPLILITRRVVQLGRRVGHLCQES